MITSEQLAEVHAKKLAETGSFDQAFKHSHWRAFEAGVLAAGGQVTSKFKEQFCEGTVNIKDIVEVESSLEVFIPTKEETERATKFFKD